MQASFAQMLKFNKEFADSKEIYRCQQAWHLKHKPTNGLFCPSNMIFEFSPTVKQAMQYAHTMQHDYLRIREMLRQINFQEMLWGSHVFGSWRNTLSIYELDKDITDSVVKSPIPDDTPISIFKRSPEWCLFLKYPEKSVKAARLLDTGEIIEAYFDGFWASFDQFYDVKTKTHEQSAVTLHLTVTQ